MTTPHYIPWLGTRYAQGFGGCRLLVVGDSFHDPVGAPGFPAEVVGDFVAGRRNYPFFSAVQRIVTGRSAAAPDARNAFWNSVAFTNMVQEPMATASAAPTDAQWRRAWACFPDLVRATAPDLVLLFSKRGWDAGTRLGAVAGAPLPLSPEHKGPGFARLHEADGRSVLCGCFYHPRFVSRNKEDETVWHRWAARLLGEAGRMALRAGPMPPAAGGPDSCGRHACPHARPHPAGASSG